MRVVVLGMHTLLHVVGLSSFHTNREALRAPRVPRAQRVFVTCSSVDSPSNITLDIAHFVRPSPRSEQTRTKLLSLDCVLGGNKQRRKNRKRQKNTIVIIIMTRADKNSKSIHYILCRQNVTSLLCICFVRARYSNTFILDCQFYMRGGPPVNRKAKG